MSTGAGIEPFTIGVEEELQLLDAATGDLVGRAPTVLRAHSPSPVDEANGQAGLEHELQQSQLETATPVCRTLEEVRVHLQRLRAEAAAASAANGCYVASAGTHATASWSEQTITEEEPYDRIAQDYAQLAQEQVVFGCHVHVAIPDRELRVQAMNHLRPWLPCLLALSTSSPYWEGRDTGYSSYRYLVFNRWPTFLTPDTFDSWDAVQSHIDLLLETGTIDGPGRLYWTVRPSARFETLEVRICDACTTVDEAVMVAGLVRAAVVSSAQQAESGRAAPVVRPEMLRAAEWRAARFGLGGDLIDIAAGRARPAATVVRSFLRHLEPALEATDDRTEVRRLVAQQLERGSSARRQRRVMAHAGSISAVVDHVAAETAEP